MTADPKVSPRPWSYEYDNDVGPMDESFWEFYRLLDSNGETIGKVDDKKVAAHIVRCVNAHDGLVEALEEAIAGMHYIEQGHGRLYGVGWARVYDKARAALAAAKEGAATDGPDEAMEEKAADFRRDMEEEIYGDL